jgi:very-short-patch-repair endonuclease
MLICKECNREFETMDGLRRHNVQKHKMTAEQTYVNYVLNGITPTCKCGCNEKPKFLGIELGFRDYKWGHGARVNNNWGHNPEVVRKSHETQKKMYNNGELIIWNKGLTMEDERVRDNINKIMANPERGKKISDKLIGIPKSEEHKKKIKIKAKIRWENQEERDKQSVKRVDWMAANDFKVTSKLETIFNNLLIDLGLKENVNYNRWHYVKSIKAFYDFHIFEKNILIEVDGDFWHCNPNTKDSIPKYNSQNKNLIKDEIKNNWCKENNIKLLRFWEKDINEKPEEIISILKKELGL